MDQGRVLQAIPSHSSAKKPIINQVSYHRRDGLDGVQLGWTKNRGRFASRLCLAIADLHIEKLDARNHSAHFIKKIKRHRDHRIRRLMQLLVEVLAVLGILVDLVLDKSVLARHHKTDNAFADRLLESHDLFRVRSAIVSHHEMLLLLVEQPDAAFIRADPVKGLFQQLEQHLVANAEEILRGNRDAQLGQMFLESRPERDETRFRKKIRASRFHSDACLSALVSVTSAGIRCGCSWSIFFISTRSSSVDLPLANRAIFSFTSAGIVAAERPATSSTSPSRNSNRILKSSFTGKEWSKENAVKSFYIMVWSPRAGCGAVEIFRAASRCFLLSPKTDRVTHFAKLS